MSHNTWLHRIARVVVTPLVNSPVTPNHLTTLRLVTGLAAATLIAIGSPVWVQTGAILFLISTVLDRADGDLARVSGKTSPGGHTYDLVADSVCNAIIFVGIGVGIRDSELGLWGVVLGALAGTAITVILWMVMRIEATQGARSAELGGGGGFDPDDAMVLVPIALLLGWAYPLIISAAIGAPLFCIFMLWHFRAKLRG